MRIQVKTLEELFERDRAFETASDRGLSLSEWQTWIVEGIIDKHEQGESPAHITELFRDEFARRYGKGEDRASKK